jgi:hypothetical protein
MSRKAAMPREKLAKSQEPSIKNPLPLMEQWLCIAA